MSALTPRRVSRRRFIRTASKAAGLLAGGAWLAGCATPSAGTPPAKPASGPAAPAPTAAGVASAPTAVPAMVQMRFGINTPTPETTPVWVAREEGLFARYGIDAELATLSADLLVAGLMSGEIPMTHVSGPALVSSVLGGSDLVFVGSYSNTLRFFLYARPEITAVRDLRGKQVAITSRGGIIRRATELTLERNGLDTERDVTMLATGNIPNSLTALLSGNVSAAMIAPPATFRAEDEGMRLLVNTGDYQYPVVLQGIAASRAWIARNEDLARRVLQAIAEGVAFTHQNKDRTKQVIRKYIESEDAELVEQTYDAQVPAWERSLRVPVEAVRADLDFLASEVPAARTAQPEQFVDNRLVDELERSGFFQKLFQ